MKKLLLKSLFLLCALVVGSQCGWAETATLTNAEIVAAGNATSGYNSYAITGGGGKTWNVYAIKNKHSNATSDKHYLQIRAYNNPTAYYIQVPAYGTKITSITMTVSSSSQPMTGGGNSATLYFSASNSTSATGTGVASGTGASSVTIDCSSLNLNTGYITAGGAVRIWDVQVTYSNAAATKVSTPSISGDENFLNSTEVSISCGTDGASIQYSTDNGNNWNDYSAPFSITETTTVKAKATKSGLTDSDEASETFTKVTPMTVAEARDAIDAGTGTTGVYVRGIVCEGGSALSSGAMNYWISDDGTETDKFEVYKGKGLNGANFTSTNDVKIGDIVVVTGDIKKYESTYEFNSGSQLFVHIPKVLAPTFSPAAGAVATNTEVTISTATADATIYYTVDGSDPNTSSSVYSTPITIDAAKTIKAYAVKAGFPDSEIATAAYTIAAPCATPTFSPAAGEVEKGSTVEISCATDGATIYYTTDGTDPTTGSTEYTSAITINSATTIKAIAAKDGLANSTVATASYTVRDYTTLPFVWAGGTSDELLAITGVTESGLGTNYAAGNAPYRIKMDGVGDYIQIKTNTQPGKVSIGIKMIGGDATSKIKIQESADGTNFTEVEELTISGSQNAIVNLVMTNAFTTTTRYVRIYKSKHVTGGNIGVGPINIAQANEPSIPIVSGSTITLTTTANMAGWRTYNNNTSNKYAVDGTTKVYYVSGTADSKVTLTEISGGVPANTIVILHQTNGSNTMTLTKDDDATAVTPGSNELQVTTTTTDLSAGVYRLGYKSGEGKGIGFYKYANASAPAGIIYLTSINAAHEFLGLDFDGETTAINYLTPSLSKGEGEYYDLQGRKVAQPTKGLYIVNGRKVIVK